MNEIDYRLWIFLAGAVVVSGVAWSLALRRVIRGGTLLEFELRTSVPWGLLDVLLAFLLISGLSVTASSTFLATTWSNGNGTSIDNLSVPSRAMLLLIGSTASLVGTIITLVFVRLKNNATRSDLGIDSQRLADDLQLGAAAFVLLAGPVFLIQAVLVHWWPSKHPLVELLKENPDLRFFLVSGFSAAVVAPFSEEYFFRVLLQGWFEKLATYRGDPASLLIGRARTLRVSATGARLADDRDGVESPTLEKPRLAGDTNPYAAPRTIHQGTPSLDQTTQPMLWTVFASAAIFALMHYSHGPDPIPLFVFALGLGFIYQRTHRVLPCIVAHFFLNALSLTMLLMDAYLP